MNTHTTAAVQDLADQNLRSQAHLNKPDRSIGAILVSVGRLSLSDTEIVSRYQNERNLRFGDAALELGILTSADIDLALSRQFAYPYLLRGESNISEEVVAAYEPFTSKVESLRALRNQLMWRWFENSKTRRTLAIVSGESQDGRSFLAANLAVVYSQQGHRTLLIDADMRNPRQHQLFGLENRAGLSSILSGRNGVEPIQRVSALLDLSVMTAGPLPPNPLELLGRPLFGQALYELSQQFDVILIDTPAGIKCADAQMIAGRAGAALIVTRQNTSRVDKVRNLVGLMAEARVHLVGTVLNDY
jgi:protein-tyrosine kinase